ncbi:amidohydrolase family protein [Alkalilimnicola ehrlichii]|uniref:amidohydrolase family protein n=1 Tax=Alkalilimnicola ehrlichii TaxID=351052 RepID=UPI001C6DFA7A|nr:amidohydrolase family protein [Alkalilimnicola ehrlichii]
MLPRSWILLRGDVIEAVGHADSPEPAYDRTLNADGKLVLPGFVNPHWHESFVAPNFEQPDDSDLQPTPYARGGNIEALGSMFGFIATVGDRLTAEEGRAIARWSLWTQLRSGTTALGDLGSSNHPDAMAEAAIDLGMRLRVSRWGSDIYIRNGATCFDRVADPAAQAADWERLLEKWDNHPSGLIGGMPSVTGAFGSSDELLIALRDLCKSYQCPYATHLAPLKHEADALRAVFGMTAIERLDALGLLTPRLLAVHTAYVSDRELQRLLDTGVNICHSPAHYGMLGEATISETKLIGRLLRDGYPISSSTDGDITYTGGMPEAMRAAHLCHNEALNDNTVCPPTRALLTGTRYAAKALGWEHKIGSIEPGKQADLVLVDIDDWRYRIGNHPLRTFLVAGGSKDVHTVIVAGRVVVAAGHCVAFDEEALFRDYAVAAASARQRIGA